MVVPNEFQIMFDVMSLMKTLLKLDMWEIVTRISLCHLFFFVCMEDFAMVSVIYFTGTVFVLLLWKNAWH